MFRYLREYRFSITLLFLLLIPVVAIDTATRAPREYRFHDRAILFITTPIQTLISWGLNKASSGIENYIYLWNTRKEHQTMIEENRRLLGKIASLREMQQENVRLRKLLDFTSTHQLQSVIARVIAKDVSTEFRAIRINRGESSGIHRNMAVITDEGIVGRVLRTTKTTADVVTMLDLLSAVDSIVERSRARGIVEGMTDEVCQLKFVIRTDDIEPGDLLITSGLGGIFPKGIPVGTVSKANRKAYGISQEVEVRPSVDFSRLEEVMVITSAGLGPTADFDQEVEEPTAEEGSSPAPSASAIPSPNASPTASPSSSTPKNR